MSFNKVRLVFSALIIVFQISIISSQIPMFSPNCLFTTHQCPNENVTFFLYTRNTQDSPTQLDMTKPSDIMNAPFVKGRPLIFLIHGYTGHKNFAPNNYIRPAYFEKGEFNVISIDYNPLALEPCYFHAVKNLPTVANCTAQLLNYLVDQQVVPLEAIHVIGFSLGGQTAGMIANFMPVGRKLLRITGLDPAKPMFVTANNSHRLDAGDAKFVDVIHTDVFQRGILMPMGHVDFYANGGFDQPGCSNKVSPGSCNHDRAPQFYAESINTLVGFYGFRCAHWYLYAAGFCREKSTDSIALMGYKASPNSSGSYFLTTNDQSPFARGSNFSENVIIPSSDSTEDLNAIDGPPKNQL